MVNRFKPISISLSPNVQKDDVALALKLLFQPWKWKEGDAVKELENEFKKYLGVKYAFSFNSGRSSSYAILKALDLPKGSDVLLQAFTCNAVPNPVLWAGLNPVYIDCANDFNIDINDLKSKVEGSADTNLPAHSTQAGALADRQMSKVLIIQHTFGLPANIEEAILIMRQNGGIVIEDCAHALGAKYQHFHTPEYESKIDRPIDQSMGLSGRVGTFGKAAFFSFARDKVISSVYGGMAVTNDDEIGRKLEQLSRSPSDTGSRMSATEIGTSGQKWFGYPSYYWIFQQIMHPILLHYIILPLYNFIDLGKLFLIFSQAIHFLSKAVSWQEKRGLKPDYFPKALPNALAAMALHQFRKLDEFNAHRQKIAEFYYEELKNTQFGLPQRGGIFLRFTVTHPKAHEIIYTAWDKENMLLGDWYTSVIAPPDTQLDKMRYKPGTCPNAENLSQKTLNLPTHINISMKEAQRVVDFLSRYF